MQNNNKINLTNLKDTEIFACALADNLRPGITISLHGNLGAGKTTLTRFILNAMGHMGVIKSPTYTLVETYDLNNLVVHHFDLYRLANPEELEFIGIREYLDKKSICLFEWPEKGGELLPIPDLELKLEFLEEGRSLEINFGTTKGEQILNKCLEQWHE